MNNPSDPAAGQAANLPPESSGINLLFIVPGHDGKPAVYLTAEDAIRDGAAYEHTDPLSGQVTLYSTYLPARSGKRSPFAKRSGKAAKRPGFAVWETIKWLAAAAIVWSIFGAIVFALMLYATR